MSDLAKWQEGNARYLAAALGWLRTRLEWLAQQEPVFHHSGAASVPQSPPEPQRKGKSLARKGGQAAATLARQADTAASEGKVAQAAASVRAAETGIDPPPALVGLARRLGLSRFEQEVLLLCAAMELDTGIAALCARAQRDPHRPYPTFALALTLFAEPAWDALSPERPLRYWRLIEINQPGGQPLTTSALRADERIVNFLKGLSYLDDRLDPLLAPLGFQTQEDLPASQSRVVDAIVHHLKRALSSRALPVVQLLGSDATSKQLVAVQAAKALGRHLYRLPVALLPAQPGELETLARLWQRESLLLPIALYLDALGSEVDAPRESGGQSSPVNRLLAREGGLVFLDTRELWPGLGADSLPVEVARPTPAEQRACWAAALGEAAGASPALLAAQFDLQLPSIERIASESRSELADGRSLHNRLWDTCLAVSRPRLDMLAQRLEPKVTWDDIVLPATESELLRHIAAQVAERSRVYEEWGFGEKMSRGFGISALFAGDSGTGKTMAAEVVAHSLRLNLYRIDLSAVVSKYIGETEKNLRRLFDAAESGGAILFFDEADALFGKRSEVKDSHDRYANIEINYLLQRMEAYRGLAILATNMKSALDPAFMRRLRFVVNFPFPGVAERKMIWQKVFPPDTPTAGLDFDRLAHLRLTGGNIHNIALNAAFRAAEAGTPVTMALIAESARTELRKIGRAINELDFRWQVRAGAVA